jgi:hypothetical protein
MSAYFWRENYLSVLIGREVAVWMLLLAAAAFTASAFGAAFTIIFAWRSDREQIIELRRKIDQLEARSLSMR